MLHRLIHMHAVTSLAALLSLILMQPGYGQFDTIINVPPDVSPSFIGSNTQLNVFDGGSVPLLTRVGSSSNNTNIEVNIFGGLVSRSFRATAGEINISGGMVGDDFFTSGSAVVNISGGQVGDDFVVSTSGNVNLSGGEIGTRMEAGFSSVISVTGGTVGRFFNANSGSTVNVSGGFVKNEFEANNNSNVNLLGGTIGNNFDANSGSTVMISGGSLGDGITASDGSQVTIVGGEFKLDGQPISGLETVGNTASLNTTGTKLLTGTLSDGTPIAFFLDNHTDRDFFSDGTLTLEAAMLPAIGPALITASVDAVPLGIRTGQTLRVDDGGVVAHHFNAGLGSTVNVETGGSVGFNFEMVGAQANILGGSVGDSFEAFSGTVIEMSGGSIGRCSRILGASVMNLSGGVVDQSFSVLENSQLNVSGGTIDNFLSAESGSTVNISGGSVGYGFEVVSNSELRMSGGVIGSAFVAHFDSVVHISGGSFGDRFQAESSSFQNRSADVTFAGADFRLNGVPIAGLDTPGDIVEGFRVGIGLFSGTLADGTPFAFLSQDGDKLSPRRLERTSLPPIGPTMITASAGDVPAGIRQGQTLRVDNGGIVSDNFNAGRDSLLNIETGGIVGENLELVTATINIDGGMVGDHFDAFQGSAVNMTAGSLGDSADANNGSIINISGGDVGTNFLVRNGVLLNISGGEIGERMLVSRQSMATITGGTVGDFAEVSESQVDISGGAIGDNFSAYNESVVHLSEGVIGDDFLIEGSLATVTGGQIGAGLTVAEGGSLDLYGGILAGDIKVDDESEVHLFGSLFVLDGVDITDSLTPNSAFTVATRDVTLSGMLADGTPFSFDLNSTLVAGEDYFDTDATLMVTLTFPGDFDFDGDVDGGDFLAWQRGDSPNAPGSLDLADWQRQFGSGVDFAAATSSNVPEPSAVLLMLSGLFCFCNRNRTWSKMARGTTRVVP